MKAFLLIAAVERVGEIERKKLIGLLSEKIEKIVSNAVLFDEVKFLYVGPVSAILARVRWLQV